MYKKTIDLKEELFMATKFSRKTFLKAGAAGLGMMALNVCTASAAAPQEDANCLDFLFKKQKTPKTTYAGTRKTLFWYSETLKQDCNYSVYLPASYDENNKAQAYPVIYLMHGVGGHQLNMIERFSTPDILNDLIGSGELPECIAVFIDGYNSFYYDGPGLAMETAIIHDLIPFIDKTYNTLASKEGRIIGGLSMVMVQPALQ